MKAIYNAKPLQWTIETKEESWRQGDTIHGTIWVKNFSPQSFQTPRILMALSHGDLKSLKEKSVEALKIVEEKRESGIELGPQLESSIHFEFKIDQNAPVSDKKSSLFLQYGDENNSSHLQLSVLPHQKIQESMEIFERFYRYKIKEYKQAKKGVEYKLIPPPSREYAHLEYVTLLFKMNGDIINCNFTTKGKKIEYNAIETTVTKDSKDFELEFTPSNYLMSKGIIDQNKIINHFDTIINQLKLKSL